MDDGIKLLYRRKNVRIITWSEINGLYISKRPGKTLSDAGLRLIKGRYIGISREIANDIAKTYSKLFNKTIPEWDGQ